MIDSRFRVQYLWSVEKVLGENYIPQRKDETGALPGEGASG